MIIYLPLSAASTEKTGNILLDLRRGQANPLLAALKSYQQAVEEGSLLLVTYECVFLHVCISLCVDLDLTTHDTFVRQ